ncbi:hypothetical protein IG206_01585 [Candidatus Parvarchaeota archaeon]|nr:hypothetical protein [Candidatus Acidifodinimicrobium mancum]
MGQQYLKGQVYLKEEDGVKTVIKRYNDYSSFKWQIVPLIANTSYPMTSSPESRLERELELYNEKIEGVNLPKIIRYNKEDLTLEKEYIEGNPPYKETKLLGELMYNLHSHGYVLGDSKIDNFILNEKDKKVYLIDSEQVYKSNDDRLKAWDIDLLFSSLSYNLNIIDYRKAIREFKSTYFLWDGVSRYTIDTRNAAVLLPMPLPNIIVLLSEIYLNLDRLD